MTIAPTIVNYNLDGMANSTGNPLVNMARFVSDPDPTTYQIYDYLAGNLILIMVFFVIFLALKLRGNSTLASVAGASIVNMLLSILLYPLGMITGWVLILSVILVLVISFVAWLTTNA